MNAIIIDDEKRSRETIRSIIELYCSDIAVVSEADGIRTGIEAIRREKPDLVFLDIELKDGISFDLLKELPVIDFQIIFITAYENYAIRAFRISAIAYLLKPVNPDELIAAVNKAKDLLERESINTKFQAFVSNMQNITREVKKIVLKTSDSIHVVNVNDIVRCEADRNYTLFILSDGKKILVSNTLKEYDEMLSGYNFFRAHQSHLVNINYISSYEKKQGGYLIMKDKSTVPVSVRKKEPLLNLLQKM